MPVARPAANEVGLRSVDHISQSMEYDEMLSWFLFIHVGFRPREDPRSRHQRARRSACAAASCRRATAAVPHSTERRTRPSHHVRAASSPSSSVFGASMWLSPQTTSSPPPTHSRGAASSLLPIPGNYYDGLPPRSGLAPDIIGRLRERSILYDRDGAGEYLQIYTPPFADRFFFEIVERRGGYEGFGASNASIRLTAQQRAAGGPLAYQFDFAPVWAGLPDLLLGLRSARWAGALPAWRSRSSSASAASSCAIRVQAGALAGDRPSSS